MEKYLNKKVIIEKKKLDVVQINLGDRCNLACTHCHIGASPAGCRNMDDETAKQIIAKLKDEDIHNIEFTGGAPELNPNLRLFIEELSGGNKNITVRTNLAVLDLPEYSFYIDLFAQHKVNLTASLPDIFQDTTDKQRGRGVFQRSLSVLKELNNSGYGKNDLRIDLVYNPDGDYLPPEQAGLESNYRHALQTKYSIIFNNLISMVNAPVNRFKDFLKKQGKYDGYMELLKKNHNYATISKVMCRSLISVDYEGYVYDCDFNLALNLKIAGYEDSKFWDLNLSGFNPAVTFGEHCYACTVNQGSSCHGALVDKDKNMTTDLKENVKKYYGEELQKTEDLKTEACCPVDAVPEHIRAVLPLIHPEIKAKYYGCGSPIPLCLDGLTVLDAGCGTGRDAYVVSKLVGEAGFVHGIDMTQNQLAIAQKYADDQAERFGYQKPNTRFVLDNMENISKHFDAGSIDLVISNCVINLAADKEAVLKEIFKVLKWGGELYFSDVYADRRVPQEISQNPLLYAECLGGALYHKDFLRVAKKAGFPDPRQISYREIGIKNPAIKKLVGNVRFYSVTYRLWKLQGLDDACEDYGHIAIYRGGIPEAPFRFELDGAHTFYLNKPERVCGNTALMLSETRFGKYFEVIGSFNEHFGEFKDCGTADKGENTGKTGGCC